MRFWSSKRKQYSETLATEVVSVGQSYWKGNILYVYSTCGIKDEANLNEVTKKGEKKDSSSTIRALVSMGAVGVIAPTVFESVGASTHGFW